MENKDCKCCCCGCESAVYAGIVAGHNVKEIMDEVNKLLGHGIKIAAFNTVLDSHDLPHYSFLMVKCVKDKCQDR